MTNPLPILYSFRRCPYAMRARFAITLTNRTVELREVVLKNKPQALKAASAKATVPVLVTETGEVIDESLDIMRWALLSSTESTKRWLPTQQQEAIAALVKHNDSLFKEQLDRYKYADRHPEHSAEYYRQQALVFIQQLDDLLGKNTFLFSDTMLWADIAIFPFIRQFSMVDNPWFTQTPFTNVQRWLNNFLNLPEFIQLMQKVPAWDETKKGEAAPVLFPFNQQP